MSAPRRGFLALVGGTLLGGTVQRRANATTPTLILPPALVPGSTLHPLLDAAKAQGDSTMHVFLDCSRRMPGPAFREWMVEGIRRSLLFDPPDPVAEERRVQAAVARHGSLVAAARAGALRPVPRSGRKRRCWAGPSPPYRVAGPRARCGTAPRPGRSHLPMTITSARRHGW